jgi:hypothetical protein
VQVTRQKCLQQKNMEFTAFHASALHLPSTLKNLHQNDGTQTCFRNWQLYSFWHKEDCDANVDWDNPLIIATLSDKHKNASNTTSVLVNRWIFKDMTVGQKKD